MVLLGLRDVAVFSKIIKVFAKGCFAKPLGIIFAFDAKLMRIIIAFDYAKRFDWDYSWFECDTTYVVGYFNLKAIKSHGDFYLDETTLSTILIKSHTMHEKGIKLQIAWLNI